MPRLEQTISVAGEWVEKVENDLKNAAHTLKMGKECPTDTVCFHAQQCIEKHLKALPVVRGVDFPKTHDIEELMGLAPVAMRPSLNASEQGLLTDYATTARYPGYGEIVSLGDARQAVRIARRVRREIRKHLPRKALSRPTG